MHDTDLLPVHPVTGLTALAVIGGRPVWPVLGGAPDDEGDEQDTGATDEGQDGGAEERDTDTGGTDQGADDQDDDKPLGPKGEKAYQAEKARRREEQRKRREAEAELAELKSGGSKDDPDQIRAEATRAATAKANAKLLRAEVRAAAAGKLTDPRDALRFLDLDAFAVGEDGDVDSDDIADAIDDLLQKKPYLAAATAKRFQGTGDGGSMRKASRPKQLNQQDLKSMTADQIDKARTDGRLDDLMSGK